MSRRRPGCWRRGGPGGRRGLPLRGISLIKLHFKFQYTVLCYCADAFARPIIVNGHGSGPAFVGTGCKKFGKLFPTLSRRIKILSPARTIIGRLRMGEEETCTTPKKHGIPVLSVCPPPPKKKPVSGKKRDPPKNGYFQPPDLDSLFTMPPRREAYA
ncbi:hypothetical protein Q3G72_016418 [Acer saccharum]|nr:hypothetical protein Q3G72_016418 [Acer saccharum]